MLDRPTDPIQGPTKDSIFQAASSALPPLSSESSSVKVALAIDLSIRRERLLQVSRFESVFVVTWELPLLITELPEQKMNTINCWGEQVIIMLELTVGSSV